MLKKRWIATFIALAMLVAGWLAGVQLAMADDHGELGERQTIINGLREGTGFKISDTSFTPPTGKMSKGNAEIALALADAKLREQGITKPTPEQPRAALIGDAQHPGVLALRAEGKGWGQIARAMDIKVGDAIRAERHERVARHAR